MESASTGPWDTGEADRRAAQRGTGLILSSADEFAELTNQAPIAPHFGDFVLGMPAAVENTCAALRAGSTSIGNLGQYFTFRLPGRQDDIDDTVSTLKAIAVISAQPMEVLVHSNLDDGFAALFTDLACSLGAVLLEQHIVDDLLGAHVSHCYGHSFSEPYKRLVFQLALAKVSRSPGTMVYGNTVMYDGEGLDNYASLGAYLSVDAAAQLAQPTGHAINPVPITEAVRIPDIDEVVDAAVFAGRVIDSASDTVHALAIDRAEQDADLLINGAEKFKSSVLAGLESSGTDTQNPLELLLALRRSGARRLEEDFGPGQLDSTSRRGRRPVLLASTISRLEATAERKVAEATIQQRTRIQSAGLTLCLCTTDVHEYGKILLEETLARFQVKTIDAGVHADPADVAALAKRHGVNAIAISTYNGVALDYLRQLREQLDALGLHCPIIMGGKTNQIPAESQSSLPLDVSAELAEEGVIVCRSIDDLVPPLVKLATAG